MQQSAPTKRDSNTPQCVAEPIGSDNHTMGGTSQSRRGRGGKSGRPTACKASTTRTKGKGKSSKSVTVAEDSDDDDRSNSQSSEDDILVEGQDDRFHGTSQGQQRERDHSPDPQPRNEKQRAVETVTVRRGGTSSSVAASTGPVYTSTYRDSNSRHGSRVIGPPLPR